MTSENTSLASLLELLELSISRADGALSNLRFDINDPALQCSVALLLAILDLARSVVASDRAGTYAAVAIVTRSAIDAYTDLVNLCENNEYWERLEAADAFEWRKVLESASRGRNPILEPLRKNETFVQGRRMQSDRLDELSNRGVAKLETKERFERAGLTNEYDSVYQMLSAEAHNNISHLRSRYFCLIEAQDDLEQPGE
jgi:hypothetical protein